MSVIIGEGCQAKVYYDKSDPEVCYKVFHKNEITLKSLLKSAELQNRVAELGYAPFAHECSVDNKGRLILYQDYLEGYYELTFDHPDLDYIIYTVINALREADVFHGDLFSGNIMVNDDGGIMIVDFAVAEDGAYPDDDEISLRTDLDYF